MAYVIPLESHFQFGAPKTTYNTFPDFPLPYFLAYAKITSKCTLIHDNVTFPNYSSLSILCHDHNCDNTIEIDSIIIVIKRD